MRRPAPKFAAKVAAVVALVVLAAWVVPTFLSAGHYRHRIQRALERSLGCPVKFSSLSFHLLPQPGFSLAHVVIAQPHHFAAEPFVRAERIDCELRWLSLWTHRLLISRLVLAHADLDLARDKAGQWNITGLLAKTHRQPAASNSPSSRRASGFDITAHDARLDLTLGSNTQPLAVTHLNANLHLDPTSGRLNFHLVGDPVRTDLSMPTPGPVEFDGYWRPSASRGGQLHARVETQGTLLDDWIPLLSGRPFGLYGVVGANIVLSGPLARIRFRGDANLTQLHRWNALPLAQPAPIHIHLRGSFDRARGQWNLASVDVAFNRSRVHLSGAILASPSTPRLHLVAAVERSHLRDFLDLARRLTGQQGAWEISGRVNGLVAIHGSWGNPQWSGFLTVPGGRLTLPGGQFPFSRLAVRISRGEAQVAPFQVTLTPRAGASATARFIFPTMRREQRMLIRAGGEYELFLSTPSLSLADLLRLGREIGWESFARVPAQGEASLDLTLRGNIHPLAPPELMARADLERGRLLIPGLAVPLYLPRARVEFMGHQVIADPVVAVLGRSVFSGRLLHQGSWQQPWHFSLQANHLNFQHCAGWFGASRPREPLTLFHRVPGLGSIFGRHTSASDLFAGLNAVGTLATPDLRYHKLHLHHFLAAVEVDRRVVRIRRATFQAGGGKGSATAVLNLAEQPARLGGRFALHRASLRRIAPALWPKLSGARGKYSIAGQFETSGRSVRQVANDLRGSGTLRVRNPVLGNFDLLGALAQSSGLGKLKPSTHPATIGSIEGRFEINRRQILLHTTALQIGGATLALSGSYTFAGAIHLRVEADLRHLRRPWLRSKAKLMPSNRLANLDVVGTYTGRMRTPQWALSAGLQPALRSRREAF
jgi:hypothetical protein